MLPGAKPDLLPGAGEQQRGPETEEMQVRRQADGSQRFGMLLLGSRFNRLSTR